MLKPQVCLTLCALTLFAPTSNAQPVTQAPICGPAKMREVLAPAIPAARRVLVDCSMTLGPRQNVTKRLVFDGARSSGVRVTCNGGHIGAPDRLNRGGHAIIIKSRQLQPGPGQESVQRWSAPRNITIEGCEIFGSVIIFGMDRNSRGNNLRLSSLRRGHTQRAQQAAPRDIVLRRLLLRPSGRHALFLSPGVTRVTLEHSDVLGHSRSIGIYLAAESGHNVIRNNRIGVRTDKREQIAVDGSAQNVITDNWFGDLTNGGIYLYRNCGEDGMIRHQPPQFNRISGNVFRFRGQWWPQPAVWLASRNGNRRYCGDDRGHDFGSSASDLDFARHNEVTGNIIVSHLPNRVLRVDDRPNLISGNTTISPDAVQSLTKSRRYGRPGTKFPDLE